MQAYIHTNIHTYVCIMQVVHWKWVATVEEAITEAKAANLTVVALETVFFFVFFVCFFLTNRTCPCQYLLLPPLTSSNLLPR